MRGSQQAATFQGPRGFGLETQSGAGPKTGTCCLPKIQPEDLFPDGRRTAVTATATATGRGIGGRRGQEFVAGERAVGVRVERGETGARVRDLGAGEDLILVGIEGEHQREGRVRVIGVTAAVGPIRGRGRGVRGPGRANLVLGDAAVAVQIERQEVRLRVGDLGGGEFAILIVVENADDRHAGPAMVAGAAGAATAVTAVGAVVGLGGENGGEADEGTEGEEPWEFFQLRSGRNRLVSDCRSAAGPEFTR